MLTSEDKKWFSERKDKFILGLSLDGTPNTHNYNRSNSFDRIDFSFFLSNWPNQGPKMTISKYSLKSFAEDIIYIHRLGFKEINGVNFAEGDFDWGEEETLFELAKQLFILLDYYSSDYSITLDQMFAKHIEYCAANNKREYKSCGIGVRTALYDVDGKKYPCPFVTPMTFSNEQLDKISKINFEDASVFSDTSCLDECYISPVCGTCAGANYLVNGRFDTRIKSRCDMNKLITIFIAEYHTRRIIFNEESYPDKDQMFYIIEAIKEIRKRYYSLYRKYILENEVIKHV